MSQVNHTPVSEVIETLLSCLSYQDQQRILRNLIWDLFGDIDDDGHEIVDPNRQYDKHDRIETLADSLRPDFWPGLDDSRTA
jgi:hypothetical protein